MIIDENHYKILDSIIKLDSKNNHSKSYILFKNYNTFLNNINNKKYIQSNLEELLKNNYNMKIFLINNLDLYNNEYIFSYSSYCTSSFFSNKYYFNVIVGIENNLLGKVTESLIDELKINREHYNVLKLMGHEFKDKENKLKDNKVKF